jgi:hypothetical protein
MTTGAMGCGRVIAREYCRTAVMSIAQVSSVSTVVSDVRHVAVPFPARSFETLECRLFRHGLHLCSGLVDLVVGVGRHGGGAHPLTTSGERIVGLVTEDIPQVRGVTP